MRLVLCTGKGGVGKTTVAAATALRLAALGHKTLLASTDTAHSLGDVLGVRLGGEPAEVQAGLAALQIDPQARFERGWGELRTHLGDLLGRGGLDAVAAEELTLLPGVAEVLALTAVREEAAGGRYDVVIVDCAPTGETLRLLGLPRVLDWYLERLLPGHRRLVRGLGPLLGGLPMPGDAVVSAVSRLHTALVDIQTLLADPGTTVRLVVTPESLALAEARRTATTLALFGQRLDAVVVNRLVPPGRDRWRATQAARQAQRLAEVRADFPDVPVYPLEYRAEEPIGDSALEALGRELYGEADPLAAPSGPPLEVRPVGKDWYELRLDLPHVRREELDLARSGDELVLTVGGHRRLLALPAVLQRCQVERAAIADGRLTVTFRPDPARWPR